MKNFISIFLLMATVALAAQTPSAPASEEDDIEKAPFQVLENMPVYKGCDKNSSNSALKKCFNQKIATLISSEFNTDVAYGLGLPDGLLKIYAIFKVDKKGHITDIKARGPHPSLEKEVERVIALIPNMERPGLLKGKPVIVPFAIPVQFPLENDKEKKLSKRELRQLKRAAKKLKKALSN